MTTGSSGDVPARVMQRAALLVLAGAVLFGLVTISPRPSTPRQQVMLLYVGADDCAPCRAWRSGKDATSISSGAFRGLTYREVRSAHLAEILSDDNWSADLRPYRDRLKRSDGVPLWLVIADRQVLAQGFGDAAWRTRIMPLLRALLTP
ncbi:hypothetical protein ACVIJ6_003407 [Bradyrhizobium sp. USDA 4369]